MNELIERLKEHREWAEANIWEVPITLPDDIAEAIEALTKKGERSEVTEHDEDVGEVMKEITLKQKELIEDMNEFCQEKFDFTGKDRKQASDYISRNIEEFKLLTMSNWQLSYM